MTNPERARMMEYLTTRATTLGPAEIRARVRAAVLEFEAAVAGLSEADARAHPLAGEWSVAEVVDHLAQTNIRSAEELRHLLAGRRPPGPPVYEGLTSGAARRVPWAELLAGLRAADADLDAVLEAAVGVDPPESVTARAVLVVNATGPDGARTPDVWDTELGWRAYALVQRLHALDHRGQVRSLCAALGR
jgi:hypothetical protein